MPRLSTPITEDEYLYDNFWTKEADNTFVDLLIESHFLDYWKSGQSEKNVYDYWRVFLEAEGYMQFTHEVLEERFEFLRKRYKVFSWMLAKPGLRYCARSNSLTAPVAVWDDIFEEDLRYMFEEVFPSSRRPELVPDRNSTNENAFAGKVPQFDDNSDTSYHNALRDLCSSRNSIFSSRPGGAHNATSEGSVNMQAHIVISRPGKRTTLRIPRPPRKPDPASCKGSSSDPQP
ncbi:zinc finger protein with KRAB and SCAN domains 2 [Striga asiatica]|uniref:Zinc finger protein with KRAB and SCAN domains 2 n=1 Tax=Striga asiatica TaxID=4170 RepID=A0A5A7Q347_STRAF|nr:zinc finger protein with KRAB and SCAN domains 2 [Striga asiatica]